MSLNSYNISLDVNLQHTIKHNLKMMTSHSYVFLQRIVKHCKDLYWQINELGMDKIGIQHHWNACEVGFNVLYFIYIIYFREKFQDFKKSLKTPKE